MLNTKLKLKQAIAIVGLLKLLYTNDLVRAEDATVITSEASYDGPLTFKVKTTYTKKGEKEQNQLELLLGKTIRKNDLKIGLYADVKSDLEQTTWLGLRNELDYTINKAHIGLQLRHFSGLNEMSEDHFYYIPYVMQELTKQWSIGIWDYSKQNYEDKKGFSYLGPFVVFSPNKNMNLLVHYGKDIKGEGNLFYIKLNLSLDKKK